MIQPVKKWGMIMVEVGTG